MSNDKRRVMAAKPYEPWELGSLGKASYMILRQFQFPDFYSSNDEICTADHDRCMDWDHDHASRCFNQHTGTGEMGLAGWLERASDEQVLAFLIDILKLDPNRGWTGYRVMGSVHRGNGYNVWTLQVFAKHPDSDTPVFTGRDAPNVSTERDCY